MAEARAVLTMTSDRSARRRCALCWRYNGLSLGMTTLARCRRWTRWSATRRCSEHWLFPPQALRWMVERSGLDDPVAAEELAREALVQARKDRDATGIAYASAVLVADRRRCCGAPTRRH